MINILLLIIVTLSYTPVLGQTQETVSNNTMVSSANSHSKMLLTQCIMKRFLVMLTLRKGDK